jgi:xanthosine utilization system XapX-like protein
MSEEEHEAAVEWVEVNLAPAPGAIALLGVAGLLRRRRA